MTDLNIPAIISGSLMPELIQKITTVTACKMNRPLQPAGGLLFTHFFSLIADRDLVIPGVYS